MNTPPDPLITHTVRATHFWYGSKETHSYECRGTFAQCKEWVKGSEKRIYYLSHNEHSRPRYRIVKLDSLGPCARLQAEWAETVDWYLAEHG